MAVKAQSPNHKAPRALLYLYFLIVTFSIVHSLFNHSSFLDINLIFFFTFVSDSSIVDLFICLNQSANI